MKAFSLLILGCLLLTPLHAQAQTDSTITALVNGTLIDGTGADPVPEAVVIIQDGRISAIGARDTVEIPDGATIIDLDGATILPGFFNTHVHDGFDQTYLTHWAQAGVTTVRDLGVHDVSGWPADQLPDVSGETNHLRGLLIQAFAIRDITWKDSTYARIVSAGPFVNVPGGYGGVVYPVSSVEETRQAVNDLAELGANSIKTALDDGSVIGENLPLLTPEQFAALVETAHEHDLRVQLHVMNSTELSWAIDAGVDEIVHMAIDPLSDELIAQAVEHGVVWVPTLELWSGVSDAHGANFREVAVDNVRRFVEAGGTIALGTDFHGYFTPFDEGMPITEIDLMQQAGMTPMQIIVAATHNAAAACNLGQDLGTLEAGKIADILVVNGDPLTDLHALLNVRLVMKDGVIVRDEGK